MVVDEVLLEKELGDFEERQRKRIKDTCGCLDDKSDNANFSSKTSILNILHLPWKAGTENAYLNLCKVLIELEHNLISIVPENSQILPKLKEINPSKIIVANYVYKNRGKFDIIAKLKIAKIIKENNIETVIVHNGRLVEMIKSLCKRIAYINKDGKKIKGIKLIAFNHGTNPKKTIKADIAVAMNKTSFNEMVKAKGSDKKIVMIGNYVEIDTESAQGHNCQLQPSRQNSTSRASDIDAWQSSKKDINSTILTDIKKPTIGILSRLSYEKGVDIALHAAKKLLDDGADFLLKIAGDGDKMQEYQDLAQELGLENNVEFLGWVEDKKQFFDSIDIYCLPSRFDNMPLSMLEAMAYKKPIVATDCNAGLELVENGVDGILVGKDSIEQLSKGLYQALIGKEELIMELGQKAYAKFLQSYSKQVYKNKIIEIIK